MQQDTWQTIAIPILEYVAHHESDGLIMIGDLADAIDADPMTVSQEVDRLAGAGYLGDAVAKTMSGGDARPWHFRSILAERGARTVGMWPAADPYATLLDVIDRRIAEESEPTERSKLQKLRSGIAEVGKGVAIGILIEVAKRGGI